jgi:H+-transporting ATPase
MSYSGLTTEEALRRLKEAGPNTLPEKKSNLILALLRKFWGPIPWMLEIIIILEIALQKPFEAIIISILLIFNASLSFFQEDRAKKALLLLKKRLDVWARVLRDGQWKQISAQALVSDDLIRIRMGDIIPADVEILDGNIAVDQSALTGESLPIDLEAGKQAFAGSIVNHGEAVAQVIATGLHTYYGKTAEIIRSAQAPSHLEKMIYFIIKYLIIFDLILIIALFIDSIFHGLPFGDLFVYSLLLLVAAVPVALPATYTLATALGSLELSRIGILTTRLSAIEEAAAMNVLCVDKTGTITRNVLEVSGFYTYPPYQKNDLFFLASMASEEATQDPIDLAILRFPHQESSFEGAQKIEFIPFDPDRKCSEAAVRFSNRTMQVRKGAPSELLHDEKRIQSMTADGARVLAVTLDQEPVGLIALKDWPREDSKKAIGDLHDLGIRLIMVTGDDASTARSIASQVGLGTRTITKEIDPSSIQNADVIASVFPKDKFQIVRDLQKGGSICGMTGDGVNDAPALKQAEVGIAMSNANDVAKASASLVMTRPGLRDIVEAVKTSRRIYQRMLTYIINKITKTLEISILLGIGLILTGQFIISPLLIILLLFANDFVTMSITTDRVIFSEKPDRWDIRKIFRIAALFAAMILGLSFSVLFLGEKVLHLSIEEIRTLIFLTLVYTGQATVYLVRERRSFWRSRPSNWMMAASMIDIAIVSFLAYFGVLMAPLPFILIASLFASIGIYYLLLDWIKVRFLLG